MPTLESLYRQDPESLPFRMPVDPQLLCIPVRIPARTEMQSFLCLDVNRTPPICVFPLSLYLFLSPLFDALRLYCEILG